MALQLTKSSTPKEEYECAASRSCPWLSRPRVDGHGTPGPVEQRRHHGDGQRADADQRAWRPAVELRERVPGREQDGPMRPTSRTAAALTLAAGEHPRLSVVHTPGDAVGRRRCHHADRQLRRRTCVARHTGWWCCVLARSGRDHAVERYGALFVWVGAQVQPATNQAAGVYTVRSP